MEIDSLWGQSSEVRTIVDQEYLDQGIAVVEECFDLWMFSVSGERS